MGTTAMVVVDGPPALLDHAEAIVRACERRWTRFDPDSELSQLNRSAGRPVLLPRDTFELVAAAVRSAALTNGRFDPTVARAMVANGYDRSFERASLRRTEAVSVPGCAEIDVDDALGAVTLPPGVTLDLGGIGKGHTADLVADELLEAGARGVLVDLGGDVRVAGDAPDGRAWRVAVEDPFDAGRDLVELSIAAGAVATSSVRRRRWRDGDEELHHVVDPSTGQPAKTALASVTVLAASASWAEVTAKAALIAGPDDAPRVVEDAGATGLFVGREGSWTALPGLEAFL